MLEVKSTDKGFLPPRLTAAQRTAISNPATGLIAYQTDGDAGYYYYDGTSWMQLSTTQTDIPAGVIQQYAASTAPSGYLLCDGAEVSRTTYARLFATIGTTYGAGNGSTTFNLPDLRQRVPVGLNSTGTFNSLGNKGGTETHTITVNQMPSHNHGGQTNNGTNDGGHNHNVTGNYSDYYDYADSSSKWPDGWGSSGCNWTIYPTNSTRVFSGSTSTTGVHKHAISSEGGGQPIPLLQPYIVVNYIIKY